MPKAAARKPSAMDVDSPAQPTSKPGATKPAKQTKRKAGGSDDDDSDDDDEGQGSDVEMLDVSFSFFDPQPQDYHSFKHLFSQLLQGDAASLDLGGVADLVLEQKLVGSTVKTDSGEGDETAKDGDPYAVLTVLNLNVHKSNPALASLTSYLVSQLPSSSPFHAALSSLLAVPADASSAAAPKHVGLVLSERLVNMPVQVVPPMYKMLQEELQWAREDGEPYHFDSLLFLSRVFRSSTTSLDEDPNAALEAAANAAVGLAGTGKKSKEKKAAAAAAKRAKQGEHVGVEEKDEERIWMYHAEDEWIQKFATHTHVFSYKNAKRSAEGGADEFGVDARGQLMLVPWAKFDEVVEGMEGFVAGGGGQAPPS
ncbi:hypothetical protein JCM8097_005278 [Rhodosporidiobolus ruineniae]